MCDSVAYVNVYVRMSVCTYVCMWMMHVCTTWALHLNGLIDRWGWLCEVVNLLLLSSKLISSALLLSLSTKLDDCDVLSTDPASLTKFDAIFAIVKLSAIRNRITIMLIPDIPADTKNGIWIGSNAEIPEPINAPNNVPH